MFHDEAYTRGLNVYTTISSGDQQLAYEALRTQVLAYDQRYGYRGPERQLDLGGGDAAARNRRIGEAIAAAPDVSGFAAAVVLEAGPRLVRAQVAGGAVVRVEGDGLRFAAAALAPKAVSPRRITAGSLIRLVHGPKDSWSISQLPQVEAAFVAADDRDGAVRALVGGFDFNLNKFDHVVQAWRQPGSSFKPFIYAAALEKGIMTSTLVNDAPITIPPELTGGQLWEPKNFEGGFEGPMRLREGLAKSKNMVSIRVLQAIGPAYARQYIARFGFDPEKHPPYLTMALGAGSVTPWQELGAYAVLANGGFGVHPYIIRRVVDGSGKVLMEAKPQVAGDTAPRVLDARTDFLIDSLLKDVTRGVGTAARAAVLGRADVAGKTGTTNESHDAWFSGYAGGLVAVAWFGFDQPRPLGARETGGGRPCPSGSTTWPVRSRAYRRPRATCRRAWSSSTASTTWKSSSPDRAWRAWASTTTRPARSPSRPAPRPATRCSDGVPIVARGADTALRSLPCSVRRQAHRAPEMIGGQARQGFEEFAPLPRRARHRRRARNACHRPARRARAAAWVPGR